jgi:hypothetical protein
MPVDAADVRAKLHAAIDRELSWIANPRHLEAIPKIDGLYRADASIEGNAVYAASRFGHAQDQRTRRLVAKLLEWQWPDGDWNCDRRSCGYRSSFHESWATAIGLAAYGCVPREWRSSCRDGRMSVRGGPRMIYVPDPRDRSAAFRRPSAIRRPGSVNIRSASTCRPSAMPHRET